MTRYRNTKRVTQPCRIVVGSSGVVSFYAPFNENFLEEFKNVFHKHDRHWNPDRKIWQIKAEGIAALVEVLNKYYNKIEGLDALIESPFDVLKITPDAPLELVKLAAKALRIKYAPDRITSTDQALELYPELEIEECSDIIRLAKEQATEYLQEVGEAEKLIIEIRESEADVQETP
ncbi:MAG: hypothetical protein ACW99G_24080 [Candidatus Thorarchaeota archaeon]|jgi:hypothetical protein